MKNYENLSIEEANFFYKVACSKNDLQSVKYLFERYENLDLVQKNPNDNTNLMYFLCVNDYRKIIKYLIEDKNKIELLLNKEKTRFSSKIYKSIFENNRLNLLKYLMYICQNSLSKNIIKKTLNIFLIQASLYGKKKFAEYLLFDKYLKYHASLPYRNYFAYGLAAEKGYLSLLKYYLSNPDLKFKPTVKTYSERAFTRSAWMDQNHIVEFFLTSKILKEKANIHVNSEGVLRAAIQNENIKLLDFLLCSPKLKEHSNLHFKNDILFINAVKNNKIKSLYYLIYDYEIKESLYIKKAIKKRPDIQKMFNMRFLNKKLNNNLVNKSVDNKIFKI